MANKTRKDRAPGDSKTRFVKLDVHEVSFVDDGANEEEQFLTVKQKRKKEKQKMGDLFNQIFGSDSDDSTVDTEKVDAGKTLKFFKLIADKIETIGGELEKLSAGETDKIDAGDETDKAKRMTDSRLGTIKSAYDKLGALIAEFEEDPSTIAKRESDKLRGDMKTAFDKVGEMFATLEKKLAAASDETEPDKSKKDDAADDEADKKKKDEADKKKAKKADDDDADKTEKADSRETPDDGDETETDKSKEEASPFRGFFGGTGVGKSIEKHRIGK